MYVERIQLRDFRNYAGLDIQPVNGLNVFYGRNAQGKTNVLESVYFCALGKSHRGARDAELIRWGTREARARVQVRREGRPGAVEMRVTEGGARRALVDEVPITRSVQLMGALLVVMFSPEDLNLIKDGPVWRRRYMDTVLCQIKPSYLHDLQVYNRALLQRNRLLQRRETGALEGFDLQLGAAGIRIGAARKKLVSMLAEVCAAEHAALSGGETLGLSYRPGLEANAADAQAYLDALHKSLPADLQRGHTTRGVHRDDVAIEVAGRDARRFGSQGQQRSAALSLRLGQCTVMERVVKKRPVLLLDDVLSELDPVRVSRLLRGLSGRQALMTCTAPLKDTGAAPFAAFSVQEGTIRRA
jgi:DNA replication and repair protein RecF